jgi:uncharacterized repeat protein (TIGR03803 family)
MIPMKKHMTRLLALALVTLIGGFVHAQTPSVLYNFGNAYDPTCFLHPGTLAQGADGNIYTTSACGGNAGTGNPADGTVFNMSTAGALSEPPYTFTWSPATGLFPNGATPYSGLTLGTDGNFYGTTVGGGVIGGTNAQGTVFKIDSGGNLTTLYTFTGGSDGAEPFAAPVEGTDGNFYGTTVCGGVQTCPPNGGKAGGTVYQLTPAGVLTTLHQFDCSVGCTSYAPLVQGTDGNLYGTTATNPGTIFKIHGQFPLAPVIQGSNGNFYGTTQGGGAYGSGVVFKMTAAGKLSVLYSFNQPAGDGGQPVAGLVQATDGNLYGVTEGGGVFGYGTIFSISPTGTGYSSRYSFDNTTGAVPEVALLQHTTGLLYGLTYGGGSFGWGTFYNLNVDLKPFVRLVSKSGIVGSSIGVLGQNFTGTTKVSFSGVPSSYTVISDTYLTATVPNGAETGAVTVTKTGSTFKSNSIFRVTPQITSFDPPSGPVGTSVVITGVSLIQTSKVTFGGVKATTVTRNSNTQVTAIVPTGAKTGNIVITTAGGTATSPGIFTVTP